MKMIPYLFAGFAFVLSSTVHATTVLHQVVTTKRQGQATAREQATVTYLDGERFRIERYPGKTATGQWSALILFDGKQTYNCRSGKTKTCRTTTGGPLSELDGFLGQQGMKVTITSFSFTPSGAQKTVAGYKCQPNDLKMGLNAEIDLGGIQLPGGIKPAAQGSVSGNSCIAKLPDWNPTALAAQMTSAKEYFTQPGAYDAFVAAVKSGAGFELEGETTVDVGGASGGFALNSTAKKTTTKVETKKPPLTAEQLKIPTGFVVQK